MHSILNHSNSVINQENKGILSPLDKVTKETLNTMIKRKSALDAKFKLLDSSTALPDISQNYYRNFDNMIKRSLKHSRSALEKTDDEVVRIQNLSMITASARFELISANQ